MVVLRAQHDATSSAGADIVGTEKLFADCDRLGDQALTLGMAIVAYRQQLGEFYARCCRPRMKRVLDIAERGKRAA